MEEMSAWSPQYPQPVGSLGGYVNKMPSIKNRIDEAIRDAEKRLAVVREAQELFNKNPDLERLLDLMQQGRF